MWELDEHPGFRRVMDGASSVAAPLLAGFAFTLLLLILPTLAEDNGASQPFSRLPELAALLLLLAGLLLVMCVQAALTARYHTHTPGELEELYPEYFRDDAAFDPSSAPEKKRWTTNEWPARRVGSKWYGGWVLQFFHEESEQARKWSSAARHLYHVGIVSLLAGVAIAVLPPADDADAWRWTVAVVAVAGALVEVVWILSGTRLGERAWHEIRRRATPAAPR